MKKINNLTAVGYAIGVVFALLSAIRYFLLYPDMDKALVYVGIGMLTCSISFLYGRYRDLDNTVEAMSIHLAKKGETENGDI